MKRAPATTRQCGILLAAAALLAAWCGGAVADAPGPADPLTTIACRDREDPSAGATLVFDLAKRRLVHSSGSGPTILLDDRDVPVQVNPATIEWEVAHNTYTLSRATLELDVIGRVYFCQLAKRQL
jgi:hypothetical protein